MHMESKQSVDNFYSQFGYAIACWASVEISLLYVFQACFEGADIKVAAAGFYAIENFRSKLGTVDAMLTVAINDKPIFNAWSGKGGLHQRLIGANKIRNKLAHFTVMHMLVGKSPATFLAPPPLKPGSESFSRDGPKGAYRHNDLKHIQGIFIALQTDLMAFAQECRPAIKQFAKSSEQERRHLKNLAQVLLKPAERQPRQKPSRG
jgi:hypothetical protein